MIAAGDARAPHRALDLSRPMAATRRHRTRPIASLSEINYALLDAVRPGVVASELRAYADTLFDDRRLRHPWATLGHSVGLAMHECFEIAADSDVAIEENMVIAIEPSHIEPGDARYDIEDMILVTARGAERLSTFLDTREMFVIQ